jgi:uncharacterized protein
VAERVLAGINDEATTTVRVSWFGAEPMIGWHALLDLSRRFVPAAHDAGIDYGATIVTNGSLLTVEKIETLRHECLVRQFDITLDGPARIHDQHRPLRNGKRSFDKIVSTLKEALSSDGLSDVLIVLRTNVDVKNAGWVEEYLRFMADSGFATDRVLFSLAPVYAWSNDVSSIEIERKEYANLEIRWLSLMIDLGLRFEALPDEPKGAVCAAVTRSTEIHSSTGNVFSCSELPLVPKYEAEGGLGRTVDLGPIGLRPTGPFDDWHDSISLGEVPCHSCTLLPVCGGSCPKQWREGNRACPPFKFTVQERFNLIARMNGFEPATD